MDLQRHHGMLLGIGARAWKIAPAQSGCHPHQLTSCHFNRTNSFAMALSNYLAPLNMESLLPRPIFRIAHECWNRTQCSARSPTRRVYARQLTFSS